MQEIELSRTRVLANDLSRARIGVAANTLTPDNYLGLTGSNVLVNVNDSGVDANQPDLQGRVLFDVPISGVDSNGHGTHVAGIIAGSGLESPTVTNASGSIMPAVGCQFRGQAPAAQVFAIAANPDPGPASDSYLQETAARTNAFISNNSWHYANDNAYDLAAARYDAAVRDALPEVSGSQPLLFVFGAGNAGNGADDGSGGDPDSVQSPATAKNVITVGAIEQPRQIADQVWQCATVNGTNICQTNQPWLGLTDTNNAVAAFSSRGNVGVGIEGSFGRFKPDVVAPGTFVVSARSTQWDQLAYYCPTNGSGNYFRGPQQPEQYARAVLSLRIGHQPGRRRSVRRPGPHAGVLPAIGPHQQPGADEGAADQRRAPPDHPGRMSRSTAPPILRAGA